MNCGIRALQDKFYSNSRVRVPAHGRIQKLREERQQQRERREKNEETHRPPERNIIPNQYFNDMLIHFYIGFV
jgi:hypothetical protein